MKKTVHTRIIKLKTIGKLINITYKDPDLIIKQLYIALPSISNLIKFSQSIDRTGILVYLAIGLITSLILFSMFIFSDLPYHLILLLFLPILLLLSTLFNINLTQINKAFQGEIKDEVEIDFEAKKIYVKTSTENYEFSFDNINIEMSKKLKDKLNKDFLYFISILYLTDPKEKNYLLLVVSSEDIIKNLMNNFSI